MKKQNNLFLIALLASTVACSTVKGPEGDSGPDQISAGAAPLLPAGPVKDSVSTDDGDQTDWYVVKGDNVQVELTLLSAEGKDIDVRVYKISGRTRKQTYLRMMFNKKNYRFNVKKDDIYVQVKSRKKSGEQKYSLVRRDLTAGGSAARTRLSVIDIYPMAGTQALVLLSSSEGLQVGNTLAISGVAANDKPVDLGDCEVSSVGGGQASCTLPHQPKSRFGRYRAVLVN